MNVSLTIQSATENPNINNFASAALVKILRIADKTNQQMSLSEDNLNNGFDCRSTAKQAS
jgi:hypothetical protein